MIVEQPTYNYALELFGELGVTVVGVPIDDDGMRVELVESVLSQHAGPARSTRFRHSRTRAGRRLSGTRRRALLELAERYDVPIVEDDFAGDLRFEGRTQPAIKALDRSGSVIYIGTFSKLLQPGLRVGYVVADGPVLDRLAQIKRTHDLTTSPLMQLVVDRFVTLGRYQAHLRRTTRLYRQRRDAMLAALGEHLPGGDRVARARRAVRLGPTAGGRVDTTVAAGRARARGRVRARGPVLRRARRRRAIPQAQLRRPTSRPTSIVASPASPTPSVRSNRCG